MSKWNTEIAWTEDSNYILRVTDAVFGQSKSSGKPMITLKYEVVAPETMLVAGEPVDIAGVSYGLTQYFVTKSIDEAGNVDLEKQKNIVKRLEDLYKAFEISFDGFDPDNANVEGFKNKTVYARLYNKQEEQCKAPTSEQLAKGQRKGDVMVNPVTKKPLMTNQPAIRDIYGLANVGGTPAM